MGRRLVAWSAVAVGFVGVVSSAAGAAPILPARFLVIGKPLVVSSDRSVGRSMSVFSHPVAISVTGCRSRRARVRVAGRVVSLSVRLSCPRLRGALGLTATIRGARLRGVLVRGRSVRPFGAVRVLPAGTLLGGRAAQRALRAVRDTNRITRHPVDELSRTNTGIVARTVLVMTIARGARVSDVNAALAAVGGRIAGALAHSPVLVVYVPDPGDVGALRAVQKLLARRRGIARVELGVVPAAAALPPEFSVPPTFTQESAVRHLLAMRMPAAWNALGATDLAVRPINVASRPLLIVADFFGNGPLDPHVDAVYNPALLKTGDPNKHGYHVVGIAAGDFSDDGTRAGLVTGALPAPTLLSPIDLSGQALAEADVLILLRASVHPGHIVLNTSLGYMPPLPAAATSRADGSDWVVEVRARGLEDRMVQATAAGNDFGQPAGLASLWNAAALRGDLADPATGQAIAPLQNTLVVENILDDATSAHRPSCREASSNKGGTIAAFGTNVYSDLLGSNAGTLTGTSMASPQIAALAEYLWSIAPDLSAPQIVQTIRATAPLPRFCQSAPPVDAYAAVLSLDHPGPLSPGSDPVRLALLDLNNDRKFNEADLSQFVSKVFPSTTPTQRDWSREDLNGDGFTGGPKTAAFDLDTTNSSRGQAPHLSTVTQTIGSGQVSFHEDAASDQDVLCYYAYSPLYTGDTAQRDKVLLDKCAPQLIAFQGPGTSNLTSSIYTVNPGGSGLTTLTHNSFSDGTPAWSPDRTQIAYASTASGLTDLRVMNADGSNQHPIRDGTTGVMGSGDRPAWSPDGQEIAYLCGCGEWRAIRPDGTGDRTIWDPDPGATGGPDRIGSAVAGRFSWSPDGSRLAVAVEPSGQGPPVEIWTVGRDGSNPTRLTTGLIDSSPDFSPDGTKIVFQRGASGEIWSMNPDGSGQTRLTTGHTDTTPGFSPDGTKIVFARLINTTRQLFTMNADGSNQTQIPNSDNAFLPAWSQ